MEKGKYRIKLSAVQTMKLGIRRFCEMDIVILFLKEDKTLKIHSRSRQFIPGINNPY